VPRRLAAATLPALAAVLACDSAAAADVPWPAPLESSTVVRAKALGRPIVVQPNDPRRQAEVLPWPAPLRSSAYDRARLAGQPIATIARATAVYAQPGGGRRIATLARRTEFGTPRWLAVVGHRRGWLRVIATELRNGRTGWIRESRTAIESTRWTIRASISRRRVDVARSGKLVRSFTVAVGKPSTPTLPGRFAVTDKLRYKGGSIAYGCCVLALTGHLPYPGNGSRMAIHGTSAPSSIGKSASFGCLRASAADMRWLLKNVWLGTVVKISA
jgi:lipoprotein-anchoring transpeptidase ErfK/SrfK